MKKIISLIVCVMLIGAVPNTMVHAEDTVRSVDGSELLTGVNESVGQLGKQTRGQYLQSGYSKLTISGPGLISVGGGTMAQKVVSRVNITVIVERLDETDGKWARVASWAKEEKNSASVFFSQTLTVGGGHYYRVRSIHGAASDVSSSFTNGILVK